MVGGHHIKFHIVMLDWCIIYLKCRSWWHLSTSM